MNTISTEEVRQIVQNENERIDKSMEKLTDSMNNLVRVVSDSTTQVEVNEERFKQIYQRIDSLQSLASKANDSVISITTKILPDIETKVALNSFSGKKMWKIAFAITLPLIVSFWGMIERFSTMQSNQIKIISDSILQLIKVAGVN